MTTPLRYRPHHFLCSLGFEGKGYSDAFTENMAAIVIGRLRAPGGDSVEIEVVGTTDDICAPCPKRQNALCNDQSKIDRLDKAHARALRIDTGDRLTWSDALTRIREVAEAHRGGRFEDPLGSPRYWNIKRMQELAAAGHPTVSTPAG